MSWLRRLPVTDLMLALLWVVALVRILWPDPILVALSGAVLAAYVAMVFRQVRRQLKILACVLGGIATVLAIGFDGWAAFWHGIEKAVIFAAFFGTLSLLRATADQRPEISRARILVDRLRAAERDSGLLVGTTLLGSVLVVGVMAVFAPIVGRDAPFETRRAAAEACQRGMCLACLWSPFWVAMALSYEHLPQVPLWQVFALGLSLNALGLVVAQAMYTSGVGLAGLGRALAAFLPVVPPVAVAAAVLLGLKAATPLTTLECLVTGVPVLCLGTLFFNGIDRAGLAMVQSTRAMGSMKGEVVLLTAAMVLGQVLVLMLEATAAEQRMVELAPPAWLIIAVIAASIALFALVGVHQFVTATVALVLFSTMDFGVAPLIVMEATLLGWAFSSMTGLSAVSVAAASAMFAVPVEKVAYGRNIRFVAVFGVIGVAILALVNAAIV